MKDKMYGWVLLGGIGWGIILCIILDRYNIYNISEHQKFSWLGYFGFFLVCVSFTMKHSLYRKKSKSLSEADSK
jgi:Trk-type K+ transport system membrane component